MEVYLDNSATTKPRKEVVDAMMVPLTEFYGNPSSAHSMGVKAEKLVKAARENVAKLFKSKPEEIVFASGGTEANGIAIRGIAATYKNRGRHIITSKFEHSSVLHTFEALEKEGYRVTYLNVSRDGFIDLEQLNNEINDETILVSIMHVNSEIGTIQPIKEISEIIKNKGKNAKFHVDAVQSYGKIPIDVNSLGVDLMSCSSHKIHGPKGVAALYVKKGLRPASLVSGGGQEAGIRPGTENVPGIVGFGKAAEILYTNMANESAQISQLRDYLQDEILKRISDTVVNGKIDKRVPHILNISFLGVRGEVLLHALEGKGIYVSTGSACTSSNPEPSHVLRAMNLDREAMEGAIRFSLSSFNTKEEIDYCIENLIPIVEQLRRFKRK